MLFFVRFDVTQPANVSNKDLIKTWIREAEAAIGAMDAGAVPHLWKVAGQRVVLGVVDAPTAEDLDRALGGLPIIRELGPGVKTRRCRSTTTGRSRRTSTPAPTATDQSSGGRRRSRLRSEARRLASSRRVREARVGFVGRRARGTSSARAIRPARRSSASARLRACERAS